MQTLGKLYKILNTSKLLSHPSHYHELFQSLDLWLFQHRHLWNVSSFHSINWPWLMTEPNLCSWLSQQKNCPTESTVEQALYDHIKGFEPFIFEWEALSYVDLSLPPNYFSAGIKGRKWEQIAAFSNCIEPLSPVLEWCAGKGHLGKLLAYQHDVSIHSVEWQAELCEAGQKEAEQRQLSQHFTQVDVLKGEGKAALKSAKSAVALHACGDLHTTLIEQAIEEGLAYLAISPCCYHLTQYAQYQPLSKLGQQARIQLSQENLTLAVKQVSTAGRREQRLKRIELAYRLGFDSWQRKVTENDCYLTIPSCSKSLLTEGFEVFSLWAAEQKALQTYVSEIPFDGFEALGYLRSEHVQKVEAVSQYFRRPLELWLVLDRALKLQESGYHVTIEKFCDKALTPRNLLVRASL
ncbi:MAG: methyltransferase [Marinomonas atlantica]|nr:methyltransferase [Marinomonas atlantica]